MPGSRLQATALLFIITCLFAPRNGWGMEPSQVMILVNTDSPISYGVAEMFQKLRGIPKSNVLRLSLETQREITREQYRARVVGPVKKYLSANAAIRCIVTTSGVPYTIRSTLGRDDGAAFDNELASVLRDEPNDLSGWQPNSVFIGEQNRLGVTDPRKLSMIYVVRLDGPDLKTITRMVEDGIAVEKTGLQGPVFGDAMGLDGITGYGAADFSVRQAIDRLAAAGFESKLVLKQEAWTKPNAATASRAAGAAIYAGWSKLRTFQDIFGKEGLARGAIAWYLSSGQAANLWDQNDEWCANLLRRGAAVTIGSVREAYVQAFPRGDIFIERLLAGETIAESYWLALPHVSWNMVLLGDPLYKPFGYKPRPSLVARAYIATNPNHVLTNGMTSSLLVQLQCIGLPGSAIPSLTAVAEAGMGLAAASGVVNIPPIQAGQGVVVRVPNVKAGMDPTGLFRLHLNITTSGEKSRRIVLEGRIGFSRLTGGSIPAAQMFVSPDGKLLISGQPGNSRMTDVETLQSKDVVLGSGMALVGAEFSLDGSRIAVALINAKERQAGVVFTDTKLGNIQTLPAGTQFLRWIGADRLLLKSSDSLISRALSGGADRVFPVPAGWSSTVIPNTTVQVLISNGGKLAIRKDAEPARDVLKNAGSLRDIAVANDLTLFGGVDSLDRLWIQRGLAAAQEKVANGVKHVVWGPISHRGVVQDTSGKARIYDGRNGSWTDLGTIAEAQWSADEERLLFIESTKRSGESPPTFLSAMIDGTVRRLCEFEKIGQVAQIAIAASGERVFLLAGLAGTLDVWMTQLPPSLKTLQKPSSIEAVPRSKK